MLIDEYFKKLPDYYDTMYLDGYTPEQITEAKHRSMRKEYQRRQEEAATESGKGLDREAAGKGSEQSP